MNFFQNAVSYRSKSLEGDMMKKFLILLSGAVFFTLVLAGCSEKMPPVDVLLAHSLHEAQQGNWEKAGTLAASVLKKHPENLHANILAALALRNTEKFQEAMDTISQAVKLAPNDFTARYLKGSFHYSQKQYAEAAEELTRAFRLKPSDRNTAILLAQSHFALKNQQPAASYYKRFLQHPQHRRDPIPVNAMGILHVKSRPAFAEKCFLYAGQLAPRDPVTALNTAIFYERTNRISHARNYYQRFLTLAETHPEFGSLVKQVRDRLGKLR